MKFIEAFPCPVTSVENVWIPMEDGVHLAARLWLPEGAGPVPAILEYIPYRKRDDTRDEDSLMHPYFAGHGYACARVDLRGSGDSEGLLEDEYLPRELDDGLAVLRWLAAQPWCDGRVGIIGISWGGFNGLQLAALRPPELGAVITLCSTDDRYADDVHYMGGCLLGDNLSWASTMFAYNSLPPDPEIVGEKWRQLWFERLEGCGPWLETWLRHQRRDAYWKHGSVCEDFAAIQVPVFAVSGWADGYSNAVFRLLSSLSVPRKGLIGPWSHKYPHIGQPGPAVGFLQEALRWWDRWLKGKATGIMDGPMLQVWMQESVPPTTRYRMRPGRWVGEPGWPSPNVREQALILGRGTLEPEDAEVPELPRTVQSPLTVGLFAGKWCSYSATPDLPHDQRQEDGGALVFEGEPLAESLEILGAPVAELELVASRPVAMVAVRLSDVAPDDKATRVTYGVLNLTHRDGHEEPRPLAPGERYRVRVQLNDIAQAFPRGNRLRLSVSTSYWPLAWPPPEPVQLTLFTGASRLLLPVRPHRKEDADRLCLPSPEAALPLDVELLEGTRHTWQVHRDLETDESVLEVIKDEGRYRIGEIDLEVWNSCRERYSFRGDDFDSVKGETRWVWGHRRGEWKVETVTRTVLTSSTTDFKLHAQLDAFEGERRVFSRNWEVEIPRDLV